MNQSTCLAGYESSSELKFARVVFVYTDCEVRKALASTTLHMIKCHDVNDVVYTAAKADKGKKGIVAVSKQN